MIAEKPTDIKINFNYETKRWMVDTPIVMHRLQLERVMMNAKAQLTLRVKGEIGDKRKRMQEAVENMNLNSVDQYLIGSKGERILYTEPNKSTKSKTMIIR
jgi:3-methyladenine DNA glycosylase Tag